MLDNETLLDQINQEFEDFQFDMINRNQHLRYLVDYSYEDKLDSILNSLKTKEVEL